MIRHVLRRFSDRLYLHPPRRARQVGRRWLWFGLIMLAVYLALYFAGIEWAFLIGGWWVVGVGGHLRRRSWAAGWEARDRRSQP